MPAVSSRHLPAAVCVLVLAAWAVLAFAVFSPDAPCADCSVKYVQAQSLIKNHFTSMRLVYPGEAFDGDRIFFPFRAPFTLNTPRGVQSIWSPVVVLSQVPFLLVGGMAAIVAVSLACGLVVLRVSGRLAGLEHDRMVPLLLGFGTCLWYYAIQPWEHMPAVAAALAAIWVATTGQRRAPLVAGLLLGIAVIIRDDSLLLLPTVLMMLWLAGGRLRALAVACACVGVLMAATWLFDSLAYGRPPAVHALQHVGVVRDALAAAGLTGPLPSVIPLSFSQRYDTVLHYWLFSSVGRATLVVFAGALVVACVMVWWRRSWLGILAIALAAFAWSVSTLWPLLAAPRTVPGLFTMSPFLVFALFPLPRLRAQLSARRRVLIAGSAICVVAALFMTDTAGGKSLGPRLILGIVPLLTIAAWQAISGFAQAGREKFTWRLLAWTGTALIVTSFGINACVLWAHASRNRMDSAAVDAVRHSSARVVVADNAATAQAFMPLYFTKVLLLADSERAARHLAGLLQRARVSDIVVVSRDDPPAISLAPYRVTGSGPVGRLTIQNWAR